MTFILKSPMRLFHLLLLGALSLGCNQGARGLSLDQPKAREVVQTVLKAWQEGRKPGDLKPDIIVGDVDWDRGRALVSFEVLSGETNDGTNLHIPVNLVIKDEQGNESNSSAIYTVGTSPVVTMFRE